MCVSACTHTCVGTLQNQEGAVDPLDLELTCHKFWELNSGLEEQQELLTAGLESRSLI